MQQMIINTQQCQANDQLMQFTLSFTPAIQFSSGVGQIAKKCMVENQVIFMGF